MRILLIVMMLVGSLVLVGLSIWFLDLDFLWPASPLLFIAFMATQNHGTTP